MAKIIILNKPYNVLSQFRPDGDKITLARYITDPSLRIAGRLDYDSEGLLLLTDDGQINQRIAHPTHRQYKTYWAQVEGIPSELALQQLRDGMILKDGKTLPASARIMHEPAQLWPRNPPIRFRANVATTWLEIKICEGRNRQVRRMTAAIGHPTLRLIRGAVGDLQLQQLQPGQWLEVDSSMTEYAVYSTANNPIANTRQRGVAQSAGSTGSASGNRVAASASTALRLRNKRRNTLPKGPRGK